MRELPHNGPITRARWPDLVNELDQWGEAERVATLWWRDDDAVAPTAGLERLLSIAGGVPVALAVIPSVAEPELAVWLARLTIDPGIPPRCSSARLASCKPLGGWEEERIPGGAFVRGCGIRSHGWPSAVVPNSAISRARSTGATVEPFCWQFPSASRHLWSLRDIASESAARRFSGARRH